MSKKNSNNIKEWEGYKEWLKTGKIPDIEPPDKVHSRFDILDLD
jgi:hypothetical protein